MVLFHPHERCFQVCFGIAVAVFPHDLKTFLIFHQAASAFFQFLVKLLDFQLMLSFPINEPNPFSFGYPYQVLLQLQDLKRGAMINLNDGVIGDLLMFCKFPVPVFFDDLPDFIHSFNHKHPGIPQVVFGPIPVLVQKRIILCIKGIYSVQQAGKMIVEAAPPDERISVCVCFDLCPIDVEFFQCDKPFILQATHELVIQFIQDFSRQLFPFKIVKSIPLGFLPFGQPDKSKISLA